MIQTTVLAMCLYCVLLRSFFPGLDGIKGPSECVNERQSDKAAYERAAREPYHKRHHKPQCKDQDSIDSAHRPERQYLQRAGKSYHYRPDNDSRKEHPAQFVAGRDKVPSCRRCRGSQNKQKDGYPPYRLSFHCIGPFPNCCAITCMCIIS